MGAAEDIAALESLPLTGEAKRKAIERINLDYGAPVPDLGTAMHGAVSGPAPAVLPAGTLDQFVEPSVAPAAAPTPAGTSLAPGSFKTATTVPVKAPAPLGLTVTEAPQTQSDSERGNIAAPEGPAASSFDPTAPESAGPELPFIPGARAAGPVQVTQEQFKTGLESPDETLASQQNIQRMGQLEGELAGADQAKQIEANRYDREEGERQRQAVEQQQVKQEADFLDDLTEKQTKIDDLREKRGLVPKGERGFKGFGDNFFGWLAVLGGEGAGKVIDNIANKEIAQYDRDRALFDDEIKGQADDFDRILNAQPSRRAATELQKTVKFAQVARHIEQRLKTTTDAEEKAALELALNHASQRAQESKLKWKQAYGDTSVTQVSRTTGTPITARTITPTGIAEARRSGAEDRFMQAMAGQESADKTKTAALEGTGVPGSVMGGPTEETQVSKDVAGAVKAPERAFPELSAKEQGGVRSRMDALEKSGVGSAEERFRRAMDELHAADQKKADVVPKKRTATAQVQPATKAQSKELESRQTDEGPKAPQGLSLERQEGENMAAHYQRVAQNPQVAEYLKQKTKLYESKGESPRSAQVLALNDVSGAKWFPEPSSSGEHSEISRSFLWDNKRVFFPNKAMAQDALAATNGIGLARSGIADAQKFMANAGRFADKDARAASALNLSKFNSFIETLTPGGVLSEGEIAERKKRLPDPATVTDFTGFNQGLIDAWKSLIETVNSKLRAQGTMDPAGRYQVEAKPRYLQME